MSKARHLYAVTLVAASLTACRTERPQGPPPARPAVVLEAAEGWRSVALPQHGGVTEDMPGLFRQLAAAVRPAAADRELLDPNLMLPRPAPAPGPYRCRIVRLGAAPAAPPRGRRAGRESFCFVTLVGDRLSLTLETAARPLGGFLWDTNQPGRLVFLGAEFGPRGRAAPPYGEPGAISTAGLLERIGDFRYRLVVRGPQQGTADVYELIAAPSPR
ncbi:MAG TPA: DUF4893 domain-containing protein [Allosphingosinicella sp.]|jgi:hypothetical protein